MMGYGGVKLMANEDQEKEMSRKVHEVTLIQSRER